MQNRKIFDYTLLRLLGKGGMAEVWYAENEIGNVAAVKILNGDLSSNEQIVERFRNEAKITVKLKHPNIRQVQSFTSIDGRPCMVMEYLEGEDLSARMKRRQRFTDAQLSKWWNQTVSALNYTHKQGVVHRDIKPSNIFITTDDEVKLLDFGIAKVRDSITYTRTGATMGTLMYMSPEQVRDSKYVDYNTDVYSLAVTFVHLLSGTAPYDFDTTDDFEIRLSIVQKPLNMSGVPTAWQAFLQPYLAKKAEDRPALTVFSDGNVAGGNQANNSVDKRKVEPVQPLISKPSFEADSMEGVANASIPDERTQVENQQPSMSKMSVSGAEMQESEPQPAPHKRKIWPWVLGAWVMLIGVILWAFLRTPTKPEYPSTADVIHNAVTDYDGNTYDAVRIGNQVWMAENLRTTRYANGERIPLGNSASETMPYRYNPYDGNAGNVSTHGYLYNWPALMNGSASSSRNPSGVQGICPDGWHVPSVAEWTELTDYVSSQSEYCCGGDKEHIAKALASTKGWETSNESYAVGNNQSANNATGFSALPAGFYRRGYYSDFDSYAIFWSVKETDYDGVYNFSLYFNRADVLSTGEYKSNGLSVRCVRD